MFDSRPGNRLRRLLLRKQPSRRSKKMKRPIFWQVSLLRRVQKMMKFLTGWQASVLRSEKIRQRFHPANLNKIPWQKLKVGRKLKRRRMSYRNGSHGPPNNPANLLQLNRVNRRTTRIG